MDTVRRNKDLVVLLIGELLAGILLICYKERSIEDWEIYVQDIETVNSGDLDYSHIKSNTLAGFIYIYAMLNLVFGKSVICYQFFYLFAYLVNLSVVFVIYKTVKQYTGEIAMLFCCISYNVHSLFYLQLSSEALGVVFMNGCILSLMNNQYSAALWLYSASLSISSKAVVYLPGVLVLFLWGLNVRAMFRALNFVLVYQAAIALPFLRENAGAYLEKVVSVSGRNINWLVHSYNPANAETLFHVAYVLLLLLFLLSKCTCGSSLTERMKSLNLPTSLAELRQLSDVTVRLNPLSKI